MADIVNLKNFRKQKARAEKEDAAKLNREKFGQTKSEKKQSAAEKLLSAKTLDGHKRDE
jgi:Domain of unknown function (DUF4169)